MSLDVSFKLQFWIGLFFSKSSVIGKICMTNFGLNSFTEEKKCEFEEKLSQRKF